MECHGENTDLDDHCPILAKVVAMTVAAINGMNMVSFDGVEKKHPRSIQWHCCQRDFPWVLGRNTVPKLAMVPLGPDEGCPGGLRRCQFLAHTDVVN